jgi:hypothetical protein
MCVKIICSDHEHEFSVSIPLEFQVIGATEIIVNYDPLDPKIDSFVNEVERMVKTGISCNVDIKVNANNLILGMRLERQMGRLKEKLDVNEAIKEICRSHSYACSRLDELSGMLSEKTDE